MSYISKLVSWVVDDSCINDAPKTEIEIDAMGTSMTNSIYSLDT